VKQQSADELRHGKRSPGKRTRLFCWGAHATRVPILATRRNPLVRPGNALALGESPSAARESRALPNPLARVGPTTQTARMSQFQFGGEFVWHPTPELIAQSNLQSFHRTE
jgi:hypothetical protein